MGAIDKQLVALQNHTCKVQGPLADTKSRLQTANESLAHLYRVSTFASPHRDRHYLVCRVIQLEFGITAFRQYLFIYRHICSTDHYTFVPALMMQAMMLLGMLSRRLLEMQLCRHLFLLEMLCSVPYIPFVFMFGKIIVQEADNEQG